MSVTSQAAHVYEPGDEHLLEPLQQQTFSYFLHEYHPDTGLTADKTQDGSPASVAATGFGLSAYMVGVQNGWMAREDAVRRTRRALRFFWNAQQSKHPLASGYNGFFYHFLDMETGLRFEESELSTIDTACLVAGALAAAQFYDADIEEEEEIRDLAQRIFRRVNWHWALNGKATLSHGWKPEKGFLSAHWQGYNESLLLYILALGSPTHALDLENYEASVAHYVWRNVYGIDYIHAGPLFEHQYPQVWIDFRGIQDRYTEQKGIDYFENSRRATYIQQQYAMDNPHEFAHYGEHFWGLTASDGPGPVKMVVSGREREFFEYCARGVPDGPDDGTIAPWVVVTSLPFAPDLVLATMNSFENMRIRNSNPYGYKSTLNCEFPHEAHEKGWISEHHYGIDQGPVVLMIENYKSELIWRLMRGSEAIRRGLYRAGFRGGWL